MKLHRDFSAVQSSTQHMLHHICGRLLQEMLEVNDGPVEVDDAYIGSKESNKHEEKELNVVRGKANKNAFLGVKDCKTNKIIARVIEDAAKPTVQEFVNHFQSQRAISSALEELAHTDEVESFRAVLTRACHDTYRHLSKKHLNRIEFRFAGEHNTREYDTIDQMAMVVRGMLGKRLKCKDLIA